jgi:cytosine deaminase
LEIGLKHLQALQSIKEECQNLVALQIVAFPQQGLLRDRRTLGLMREAFSAGADVMGCASNMDCGPSGGFDIRRRHIDAAFDIALEFGVDLDVHADNGLSWQIELDELEVVYLAKKTIECGYQGRVSAGHACKLDSADPEIAKRAMAFIKEADLNIVSQPDLPRLGRDDRQHVRRGLTRVKELLQMGINVSFASNNVRDAIRPFGNFDLLEEGLILAYGAQMDTVDELDTLMKMCTWNPAKALRLPNYGLDPGCKADMVVIDAPSAPAAIISQAERSYVIKAGEIVAAPGLEQIPHHGGW